MRSRIACGLIVLGVTSVSIAQTTAPSAGPTTAPAAAPATQPAERAALPEPALPDTSGLSVSSLQAVRMAYLQMMPWQTARVLAADKIESAALKRQAAEGLDLLAPKITRALMDRKSDTAFVSVAVYRKPPKAGEPGEQAAVSLTFEGFGKRMDDSYLPRVLSDLPRRPQEGQPDDTSLLVLDPAATSHLCISLNTDGLVAAVMSHKELKRDVAAAVARGLPPPQRRPEAAAPPSPAQEAPPTTGASALQRVVPPPAADYGSPADYAAWDATAWWWSSGPAYVPYYVYDLYGYSSYSPLYVYSDYYYHRGYGRGNRADLYQRLADRAPGRPVFTPPIAGVPSAPAGDWGRVPRGLVPWLTPRVQTTGVRTPTDVVGRYNPSSGLRLDPSVGLRIDPMGLRVPPPGTGTAGSFAQPTGGFRGGVPGGGQTVVNPVPPAGIQVPSFQNPPVATPAGRLGGLGPDRAPPPAGGDTPQRQPPARGNSGRGNTR